jgi:hypothetical protein
MRSDIAPGATFPDYTDPDNDPMIPHTLVLKPGLVVHSIYNGYWLWGRPSIVDLWRAFHGWNKWDQGKLVAARKVTSA